MQYRHSLQKVGVSAILLAKDFLKFNSSPSGWSLTGGRTVESYKSRHFRGRSKRVPQLGCFLVIPLSLAIQYQPVDQESFIREIQINSLQQFLCVFKGPFQSTPSMVVISLNMLAFFNVSLFIIIYLFSQGFPPIQEIKSSPHPSQLMKNLFLLEVLDHSAFHALQS